METINLTVKESSVQEFVNKYVLPEIADERIDRREVINPYNVFGKDEIYVRNSITKILGNDKKICITLSDKSRMFNTSLKNVYTYEIFMHDSLSLMLKLIDFKVEVKND